MTNKVLKFAVENISPIEDSEIDKSQFSMLLVDCFSTIPSAHDTFVTEENLKKVAKTILLKPFVFYIDERFGDLGGHNKKEVPGGFVPSNSPINFKKMDDGHIMMSVQVLIWKRYSSSLLEYFKRDNNKKSVSVEIEILDAKEDEKTGLLELINFTFNAITGLGDVIRPAIPNAQAILQYSQDFEDDKKELQNFERYDEVDFNIPESIQKNCKMGLEKGMGGSVAVSMAKFILKNQTITPKRIRQIYKFFKNRDISNMEKDILNLYGGNEAREWAYKIVETMDELDKKQSVFFEEEGGIVPYQSLKDANPSIKGIDPAVTLAQANEIAKQAESIGVDEDKNGWAIAISNFKKTHKVEDEKWVSKEKMSEEIYETESSDDKNLEESEKNSEDEEEKREMKKEDEKMEEKKVEEKEEMAEEKPVEKKEEEKMAEEKKPEEKEEKGEVSMSLDANLDVSALLEFLRLETKAYRELGTEEKKYSDIVFSINACLSEIEKGNDADIKFLTGAMIQYMKSVSANFRTYLTENKGLVTEVDGLRKFKFDTETQRKDYEVNAVLKEAFDAGMPKNEIDACREESKKFSLENIESFKNSVKAKAFKYFGKLEFEKKNENLVIAGFPFDENNTSAPSLWK